MFPKQGRIEILPDGLLEHKAAEEVVPEIACPADIHPQACQRRRRDKACSRQNFEIMAIDFIAQLRHIRQAGEDEVAERGAGEQYVQHFHERSVPLADIRPVSGQIRIHQQPGPRM